MEQSYQECPDLTDGRIEANPAMWFYISVKIHWYVVGAHEVHKGVFALSDGE